MREKNILKQLNKKLFYIVVILTVLFFVSQMYFTAVIGTQSGAIELVRQEKEELRLENEILSAEIDEQLSTQELLERAQDLNLTQKGVIELDRANSGTLALTE